MFRKGLRVLWLQHSGLKELPCPFQCCGVRFVRASMETCREHSSRVLGHGHIHICAYIHIRVCMYVCMYV